MVKADGSCSYNEFSLVEAPFTRANEPFEPFCTFNTEFPDYSLREKRKKVLYPSDLNSDSAEQGLRHLAELIFVAIWPSNAGS